MVLGFEWEESLENAVAALQPRTGPSPISLSTGTGEDALLHFFLYPASGHRQIADGDHIDNAISSISAGPTTRVILAACAPTTPALDESAVIQLAEDSLTQINRKYGVRAMETVSLQTIAERHLRHVCRQLGILLPDRAQDLSVTNDDRTLLSFEDRPWSY